MKPQHIAALVLVSLYTIAFCASGAANDSSLSSGGVGINDSGFRPGANGFGFQNYGADPNTVDLTAAEMQRMFGDQVCASKANGQCVLTYPAERWMNFAVSAMKSGHCEGLAVLSSLMYYNQSRPDLFGGNETIDLALQNILLQREIGYWWTTQVTSPGGSKRVKDSPEAVLDTLSTSFDAGMAAGEWWVMGIYLPDGSGGHAITPFAVEDMGNGTSRIFVYDNNWPKDVRYVEVDRARNSWSYQASTNPDEPGSVYTGNASTKNLEIVSLSSRLGQQRCDFCDSENSGGNASSKGAAGSKNIMIWQSGRASVMVTDDSGRRTGLLEGSEVNEIPGAEVRNLKFGVDKMPVILLPYESINASHISIEINSTANASGNNPADTAIFAPGFALGSSISNLGPGLKQNMDLISLGQEYNVSISANSQLSPIISVDTDHRRISLSGMKLDPSGLINLSMNLEQGVFGMNTLGNLKPGTLEVMLSTLDPATGSSSSFKSLDVLLRNGDGVSMDFAGLSDGMSSPSLSVARNNGGRQEMSMITVSRDVPASVPEIPDMSNLTSSARLGLNSSSGNASMQGAGRIPSATSVPGSTGMPGAASKSGGMMPSFT
jgi:hypothetical protein